MAPQTTNLSGFAIPVGISICTISAICFVPNCFVITITLRKQWMTRFSSYKLLLTLCFLNLPQICAHFITGILTIFPNISHPTTLKWCGTLTCSCYVSYCAFAVILALNRLLQWTSPYTNEYLFSSSMLVFWFTVGASPSMLMFTLLSLNYATVHYCTQNFFWYYDYNLPNSYFVQKIEMCVEFAMIFISLMLYGIFIFKFIVKRNLAITRSALTDENHQHFKQSKKGSIYSSSNITDLQTMLQTVGITALCLVLNVSWHLLSKRSLIFNAVLTFMWILTSGVTPFISIWANKVYRQELKKLGKRSATAVSSITVLPTRTSRPTLISSRRQDDY